MDLSEDEDSGTIDTFQKVLSRCLGALPVAGGVLELDEL